jgi:translation elongation factor EF-Tu-like GTPase
MKKRSTFQINDTFRITGRGIIFAGNISSGLVSIGDLIEFNFEGNLLRRKITGIEGIRSSKEENNCGLLIESISEQEITNFKTWEPNGIQANIYTFSELTNNEI